MSRARWIGALALMAALSAPAFGQEGLGDPTRPTSLSEPAEAKAQAAQGPRWRLQSTLVADDRRVAVINGRMVAQGERIEGATVLEVRTDGVTLQKDGQRLNLLLPGSGIGVKRGG